ncbi:hypothetical protein [Alkalispirochaeta alkalica]|uniref:hypothetical protein n=1 Tax=Alkalispirochaeta alkalica TaxID=46356 RepID=UPI00038019AD|nr:hypothetical protein [Alkalispirochaeta alkalica]
MRGGEVSPVGGLVLVALAVVVLSAGCSLVPEREVSLRIPALPPWYESGDILWRLSWWDGRSISHREIFVSSEDGSASLAVPLSGAGAILPVVTATPVLGPDQGLELASFGGWLLPGDDRVLLDRHRGEISLVLLDLARQGLDPALVNVERLEALVRERLPRYPRRLDRVRLTDALGAQRMHSHHVAKRWAPMYQVRLLRESSRGEGWQARPWITDDPAEPPLVPAPAGEYELFSLGVLPGEVRHLWRWSSRGGTRELLVVYRTHQGQGFHRLVEISPGGEVLREGP